MPTMDGYEFVRRLRSVPELAKTPVIFCTPRFRERDARDQARQCGVEHVLVEPVDLEAVQKLVDTLADKTSSAPVGPVAPLLTKLMQQTNGLSVVNHRWKSFLIPPCSFWNIWNPRTSHEV